LSVANKKERRQAVEHMPADRAADFRAPEELCDHPDDQVGGVELLN
jgi:hypothetical protein